MKLRGPFAVLTDLDRNVYLQQADRSIVCRCEGDSFASAKDTARRIAAALNAAEAEESRRSTVKAADERLIEAFKKTPDSATGAFLTKRRPARGGAK